MLSIVHGCIMVSSTARRHGKARQALTACDKAPERGYKQQLQHVT